MNKFLDCGASLSRPVRFDLRPTYPSLTVSFGLRYRCAMRVPRSDGLRCDFSTNKHSISTSKMRFCNFNSKSDGRPHGFIFFSFKYSSSLSSSESGAKTPLPDSLECFFDPQRSFGNSLRTFRQYLASPVLEKSKFFLLRRNFPP